MSVPSSRRAARALLIAGRASPAASLAFTFLLRRSSHSSRLVMGQKRNHGAIASPAAPSGEPCPPAPPSMAPSLMSDPIGPETPTPPAPPLPEPPAPPAPPLIVPLLISVPIVPELAIPAPPAPPRVFSSVMGLPRVTMRMKRVTHDAKNVTRDQSRVMWPLSPWSLPALACRAASLRSSRLDGDFTLRLGHRFMPLGRGQGDADPSNGSRRSL